MMKLMGATAFVLAAGCGLALAQTTATPTDRAPTAVPDAARPVEAPAVAPGAEVVPARPVNDPNTTGPDKINGLEVPQMKGEPPAAR